MAVMWFLLCFTGLDSYGLGCNVVLCVSQVWITRIMAVMWFLLCFTGLEYLHHGCNVVLIVFYMSGLLASWL